MILNKKQMKYVGCLVGSAVGDALGYAVEFYDDYKIFEKYGENGIVDYRLIEGKALISDDTQMTLFTAEGLLSAKNDLYVDSLYRAYLNWYLTQKRKAPIEKEGLLSIPTLYDKRAPGNTCLGALESGVCGTMENPINLSKGCGGIMRVAPIALYCHTRKIPIRDAAMLAARAAAITHGHELGYIPAAMLADIIYRILEGAELMHAIDGSIASVKDLFKESVHINDAVSLLNRAIELSFQDLDDLDAIRELGQGWVAEETLAIAVYCCLKHSDDFEKTIIASVNHSGDSDSTGAVAGSIIGAYLGAKSIPQKYLNDLELIDIIVEMAMKLCDF
jgi:ADP-ribosylglycohydrolase